MAPTPKWHPPDAMAELLPQDEATTFRREFLPRWSKVLEDARSLRDSVSETEDEGLLREFAQLLADMSHRLGARWAGTTRHVARRGLRELFETAEAPTAEPDRRFLLRQLEYALNIYAELFEASILELERLPNDDAERFLENLAPGDLTTSPADHLALRWQLDLFLAMDSVDRELDELQYWSDRAVLGARRVRALVGSNPTLAMRAEIARHRAKAAWHDWEDADIEQEVAAWPESPS